MSCCQWADEEALATERFDCGSCPVALAVDSLDGENLRAWRIFHQIALRIVVDTHIAAVVLERVTQGWSAEDMVDLIERLNVIDDVLRPVRRETASR